MRRPMRRSGFVHLLKEKSGKSIEVTREEFSIMACTPQPLQRHDSGSTAQIADHLEEIFEATGSRGGFMLFVFPGGTRA